MDVRDVTPIRRAEVWRLADVEYARFVEQVRTVRDEEWSKPTDCIRWDVRALCLHVLGAMEAQASPRELAHQFRRGLPLNKVIAHDHWVDGVNELQIRERNHLTADALVDAISRAAPKAVKGRRRVPPPFKWAPMPMGPPIGWKPLTYLLRMGFTRDVWMHRVDLTRATGRPVVATAEHDGRIVADIVAEWARMHRMPFSLTLDGPAGGTFRQRGGGESLHIDAVEFCRILSGRGPGSGLLEHKLPL